MKAIISGQAGCAILMETGSFRSVEIDSIDLEVPRTFSEVRTFLGDSPDAFLLRDATKETITKQLENAWRRDRALQMALILLDPSEAEELRKEAAECLEELLSSQDDRDRLAEVLYSSPLPEPNQALRMQEWGKSGGNLVEFGVKLLDDQPSIRRWCEEWESIPDEAFGGFQQKRQMRLLAVRAGAFRLFVEEQGRGDAALLRLHISEEFRGKALGRKILQRWAGRFRTSISNTKFPHNANEEGVHVAPRARSRPKRRSAHDVFVGVGTQKDAIKKALEEGRRAVAMKYTQELVVSQRKNSQVEHISKSLCDLAQHGKMLGDYGWHLELSRWAAREMPTDSWAWAQAGDGFRLIGDYNAAIQAYETAGSLGERRVALCGRAEMFKDHGQTEEALKVYEACASEFPGDSVPLCGRASALASVGRLAEAVTAYEMVLMEFPENEVAETGLAGVLGATGEFERAFRILDKVNHTRPNSEFALCGQARLLRNVGKLEESLAQYEVAIQKMPLSIAAHNGRAKTLRDLGELNESLAAYDEIIDKFEHHPAAHYGRADILKKLGRLDDAATAYKGCLGRMPKNMAGRNGLASVLAAQGQSQAALDSLLDVPPASFSDWVGYHLRGAILLAQGDVAIAESHFRKGLQELPWVNLRPMFRASLASAKLRQRQYAEAAELVAATPRGVVWPVARLFEIHAFSMLDKPREARAAYDQSKANCPPALSGFRDALAVRFLHNKSLVGFDDAALYQQECLSLFVAA